MLEDARVARRLSTSNFQFPTSRFNTFSHDNGGDFRPRVLGLRLSAGNSSVHSPFSEMSVSHRFNRLSEFRPTGTHPIQRLY